MLYTVNSVPVLAVAIIEYPANAITKETRTVLRSRRGEEVLLLSAVVRVVVVLCGEVPLAEEVSGTADP